MTSTFLFSSLWKVFIWCKSLFLWTHYFKSEWSILLRKEGKKKPTKPQKEQWRNLIGCMNGQDFFFLKSPFFELSVLHLIMYMLRKTIKNCSFFLLKYILYIKTYMSKIYTHQCFSPVHTASHRLCRKWQYRHVYLRWSEKTHWEMIALYLADFQFALPTLWIAKV